MGYRTSERRPFIEQEPNNQGFYYDIYQVAAERVGCKLRVIRAPKLRILRDLKLGNIDFYPGLHFKQSKKESRSHAASLLYLSILLLICFFQFVILFLLKEQV